MIRSFFEIFFGKEYQQFVNYVLAQGPRILELGCGEGNLTLELASHGLDLTAIDLSPERHRAGSITSEGIESWRSAELDRRRPQYFSSSKNGFDCAVAHDSLHHILHLGHLCEEVTQALKPDGRFIIMDYVGMGFLRKLVAGFLYGILPTYQPYTMKWRLRKRLSGFLADRGSEEKSARPGVDRDSPRTLPV